MHTPCMGRTVQYSRVLLVQQPFSRRWAIYFIIFCLLMMGVLGAAVWPMLIGDTYKTRNGLGFRV